MSLFLTRPHASRPWWQKSLIILRNWFGWIAPAVEETLADDVHPRHQVAAAILVLGTVVPLLFIWVVVPNYDVDVPLNLLLIATVVLYLCMGGFYHSMLLQQGGCYHTERRPHSSPPSA